MNELKGYGKLGQRLLLVYTIICAAGVAGYFLTRADPGLQIVKHICTFLAYGTAIALIGTCINGLAQNIKKTGTRTKR